MQEAERREQKPKKDQQRKHEHICRVAQQAGQIPRLEAVGDILRILRRAVEPLAVVIAVMTCEKRAGSERHHSGQQVPRPLEERHLVLPEMADFVNQRSQPVEPEGRHRKGQQLGPGAKRQRQVGGCRGIGSDHAEQKVGPVADGRDPEKIGVGVADRLPHLPNPGGGIVSRLVILGTILDRSTVLHPFRLHVSRLERGSSPQIPP